MAGIPRIISVISLTVTSNTLNLRTGKSPKSPGTPPHHTELATKMENKSKRNQVITYNIQPQERQLPRNTHQSNSPATGRIRKLLRTTLRSQTELENTH